MGLGKKLLGTLALAGAIWLADDAGKVKAVNDQRTVNFTDELVLQEPPMELTDAYIEKWYDRLQLQARPSMEERKTLALLKKLDSIGEGDTRIAQIVTDSISYNDERIKEAASKALGRINTPNATNALYKLLVESGKQHDEINTAYYAAKELLKVKPELTARTILNLKKSKFKYIDTYEVEKLMKIARYGDPEASLLHMISSINNRSMGLGELADFLIENRGKPYIRRYENRIIDAVEPYLVNEDHGGYLNCSGGSEHLYKIIKGLYAMDPIYAKKRYLPLIDGTECAHHWIKHDLQTDDFF